MKNIYAFLVLTMVVLNSRAQFSSDNLHPMALCNATGNQTNIQVLDDGSGGYFVFWLDNRLDAGKKQVYAQHLDQDGLAQWAADGKVLTDTGRNTTGYRVAAWQSGVLLSWFQQGFTNAHDTVFCKYISSAGSDLWAQPTTVAYSGNGFLYMDLPGFNIFPNDSGAFIVHSYTYTGGSSGLTYNRIDFNGNLRWPALSKTQTLYGYDYRSQTDNQNGFFALSKGNGVGSTMYIQRFDLQGNMMWVNPLDITSGGTLNGFSGNITMQPDARGNLYVVWDNSSSNVVATKVTAQGAFAWSNLRVRMSDTSQYFPQHSSAKLVGDTLYVTWVESRKLPTYFSMIQKLDSSGNKQLIASGMMVDTSSGVYGFPKLAVSDSGSIVNVWQGLESSVLAIQRIRPDGSRTWPGNRKVLSADRQNLITDSDYEVLDNNQGCNVVFWASNYSNVFGAEACSPSIISGLQLSEDNTPAFEVYPNPSDGVWRFQNIPEGTENLVLSSTSGTRIATLPVTGKEEPVLSIGGLSPGIYFISVDGKEHSFTRKVIVGR